MRALLVDHYDSFTFNLFQLVADIMGVEPHVVTHDVEIEEVRALDFDRVILGPGPGRPDRPTDFGISARLIAELDLPILGVCLGHQGIGHVFGAEILTTVPIHGRATQVAHDGSALFAGIPSPFTAVRYHSLALGPLPPQLRATAWSGEVLMALEHVERPLFGVQFHPESIGTQHGRRLLENFLGPGGFERRSGRRSTRPPHSARKRWQLVSRELPFANAEDVFLDCYAAQDLAFWLDSAAAPGRFSYMGDASGPHAHLLRARRGRVETIDRAGPRAHDDGFLEVLGEALEQNRLGHELPFDFAAGYVGYLGYELSRELGLPAPHAARHADAQLIFADRMLVFDHRDGRLHLVALAVDSTRGAARSWMDDMERRLGHIRAHALPRAPKPAGDPLALGRGEARYRDDVARCLEAILAGESYEVCLTDQLRLHGAVDALALHRTLRRASAAPYAAYLRFGHLAVSSASPERFLRVTRDGVLESRPIKGTAARGDTHAVDEALRLALAQGEKTRSENLMIVDLLRNDLGRVAEIGSVHVPSLMEVEAHPTVHQLVSTIRAQHRRGPGGLPRREHDRRPQVPHDGDHRGARAGGARDLLRRARLVRPRRGPRSLGGHPHRGGGRGRRRHRRRGGDRRALRPQRGDRRAPAESAGGPRVGPQQLRARDVICAVQRQTDWPSPVHEPCPGPGR